MHSKNLFSTKQRKNSKTSAKTSVKSVEQRVQTLEKIVLGMLQQTGSNGRNNYGRAGTASLPLSQDQDFTQMAASIFQANSRNS